LAALGVPGVLEVLGVMAAEDTTVVPGAATGV
jgi:hypothetical protein